MHAPRKLSARSCALRSPFPSPLWWPLDTCAEFSRNALKPPFSMVLPATGIPSISRRAGSASTLGKCWTLRRRARATADPPQAAQFLPKHNIPLLFVSTRLIAQNPELPLNAKPTGDEKRFKTFSPPRPSQVIVRPEHPPPMPQDPTHRSDERQPGRARQTNQSPTDK